MFFVCFFTGDPSRFHSFFIVVCLEHERPLSALEMIRLGRLGSNVKKTVVLCSIDSSNDVFTVSLEWSKMSWINLHFLVDWFSVFFSISVQYLIFHGYIWPIIIIYKYVSCYLTRLGSFFRATAVCCRFYCRPNIKIFRNTL